VIARYAAEPAASTLRALRATGEVEDALARERVRAREAELGGRLATAERYAVYGAAPPLAVSPAVGELLYALALTRRPRLAVEFGTSHGISAIYLAAALRDAGAGSLISAELLPEKAQAARANLAAAGLADLVEVRTGDALATLHGLPEIDLLFLDGRNDLYLDVLRMLEPVLAADALVLADASAGDPDLVPYFAHVRARAGGYRSQAMLGASGLEVSFRCCAPSPRRR
jgi:predicted O-methyltransferase YrrM